jgi:hypothetical protein
MLSATTTNKGDCAKAVTDHRALEDADPDIPILKQAKVEYGKLQ